jgi:hypothetical protein
MPSVNGQVQDVFMSRFQYKTLNYVFRYLLTRVNHIRNWYCCLSLWPRGLTRRSAAARLLRLWVRIPPGHRCLSVVSVVSCQVEVSATGWSLVQRSPTDLCVVVCDLETSSRMRMPWPALGCSAMGEGGLSRRPNLHYLPHDTPQDVLHCDRWTQSNFSHGPLKSLFILYAHPSLGLQGDLLIIGILVCSHWFLFPACKPHGSALFC